MTTSLLIKSQVDSILFQDSCRNKELGLILEVTTVHIANTEFLD
jgi:hypothetical protein